MPIIKDKYKAKRNSTTPIVQRNLKANPRDSVLDNMQLTTDQKQAIATQESRQNINTVGAGSVNATSANKNVLKGKVSGYNLQTANVVENIFTLNANETLNNILISHQHASSSSSVVSLFWSLYPPGEIETTVGAGRILTTDGKLFRLMSATFLNDTTLNLYESCQGFGNINKTIYFYGITSVVDSNGLVFTFLVG